MMIRVASVVCVLMAAMALFVTGCGSKPGTMEKSESDSPKKGSEAKADTPSKTQGAGGKPSTAAASEEPQSRKRPDFPEAAYASDFSTANYEPVEFGKLDYAKGPEGQAVVERKGNHPKEKDSPYSGKPYSERGYMGQGGSFIRHGIMKTWYMGG